MFTSLHGETSRQFSELKAPESLRTLSQSSQRHDLKPNKPFSNGVYDVYTRKETDTTILIASTLSVHGLLSSYLLPLVSDGLLRKLNDLFALIPSEEGTVPARPPQSTAPSVSPNSNTGPPSKFLSRFPGLSHYVMPDGHVSYNIGDFVNEVYDGRSYIPDDSNVPQPPPGARCGDMVAQVHRPHPLAAHAYHMLINPTGPRGDIGFGIDGRPKGGANTGGRGGNGSGASQKKYTSDRKVPPKMACTFCRARKIACGIGNGTGEDKTCKYVPAFFSLLLFLGSKQLSFFLTQSMSP